MSPKESSTAPKLELFCKLQAEEGSVHRQGQRAFHLSGSSQSTDSWNTPRARSTSPIVAGEIDAAGGFRCASTRNAGPATFWASLKCDCRQQLEEGLR